MKQQDTEQQQSSGIANQSQGKKQADGPDEPLVNEEEQNKAVNPEDEEHQVQTADNDKKKGFTTAEEKERNEDNKNRSK